MNGVRCGVLVLVAVVVASGCKDPSVAGRPKLVPAGGLVLYNGQPLDGATVTFNNRAANVSGYATTGPDGRFVVTTFAPNDGAAVGPAEVAVRKVDVIEHLKPGFDYSASNVTPPPAEEKWRTPKRYSEFKTSGLAVEVTERGPNDFTLELKD